MANENRVNLSCTVKKNVKERLKEMAHRQDRTLSWLASKAIEQYVQQNSVESGVAPSRSSNS